MNDTLQLKESQIDELADLHIERYQGMIDSGHPAVRVDECQNYIRLWKSIKQKNKDKGDFTSAEEVEITDAVMSGDYEDVVRVPESVHKLQMP